MSVNIVGWIAQFEKTSLNSTLIKKQKKNKSVDTMEQKWKSTAIKAFLVWTWRI